MSEIDNIGKRILQILKDNKVKPTPFEESAGISRGYLKKVSESGAGIGSEIVEKILLRFPDVDARWLITGQKMEVQAEKSTHEQKMQTVKEKTPIELAELIEELQDIRDRQEVHEFRLQQLEGKKKPDKPASLQKALK